MTSEELLLLSSGLAGLAVFLLGLWIGPVWDRIAVRQVRDLTPRLEQLNIPRERIPFYMRLWGATLFGGAFLVAVILRMPLVAVVVVFLIFVAPRFLIKMAIDRRRGKLRDQMVTACVTLSNTSRAGLALAQGLEVISKETPEPLAQDLNRMVRDYQRGRPLAEAIRDTKERLNLDSFTLFSNAILTCLERGGKVTEALERISSSLQENQRLERKLEADTASGRRVILLLALFPVGFLLMFYMMDPDTTGLLFSTLLGQIVLVVIAGLVYGAVMWARNILAIDT